MRVYECNRYESEDKNLISRVKIAKFIKSLCDENPEDSFLEIEQKTYLKIICNDIRQSWNIENVLCLAYIQEENSVVVIEFPVKADNYSFYNEIEWDEESKKYYFEMK